MTDTAAELLADAATINKQNRQNQAYNSAYTSVANSLSLRDAQNLTNILSTRPSLSQEAAAAAAISGMEWDNPLLSDLASADLLQQETFAPYQWLKAVGRGAFTGMESLAEASFPTWGRTITRVLQGEPVGEAWRVSNQNYLSEMARQHAMGNPIEIGDGWFPNSTPVEKRPGYQEDFLAAYQKTNDMNASMQAASQASIEKYGTVLTQDVHDVNNSTLVNKTIDGVPYSTPYSLGRAMAIQVTHPDTVPFNVMSGLVDANVRILGDPINAPFYEVGLAATARRRIIRDLDQVTADQLWQMRAKRYGIFNEEDVYPPYTVMGETRTATPPSAGGKHDITLFIGRIDEQWDELRRWAERDPNAKWYGEPADPSEFDRWGEAAGGLPNPYGRHNPDLTVGEVMEAFEAQGGKRAFEDFILEHELVHANESDDLIDAATNADRIARSERMMADHQALEDARHLAEKNGSIDKATGMPVYMDEDLRRVDEAQQAFDISQAEYHEFISPITYEMESRAEQIAMERLMDPNIELAAVGYRQQLYRDAGLRHRWRPWLKPNQASDWINSNQAAPVLDWLAREHRFDQIRKRIPGLPFHAYRKLQRAESQADIVKILMPYLGKQIDRTPRLGLARNGGWIQFNPYEPNKGYATHEFTSKLAAQIKLTGRRLGAESRPIVLNPYNTLDSADAAVTWLKTVRATDDEIESVLRLIETAGGSQSYSGMADAYQSMVNVMTRRMKELGYNHADLEKVYTQMRKDAVDNQLNWVNNASTPVHRWDDGYNKVIVATDKPTPHLSAATEAQFSNSYIGLPNLRDTRRATAPFRAKRESLMRAFADSGLYWGDEYLRLGFDPGWVLKGADTFHNFWRSAMLMRFGWPVRVVGEEMLRARAYGYGHWYSHPMDVLAQIANSEAKVSLLGDSLKDITRLDGLGAGGWRDPEELYDMSRATWTTAERGQAGYNSGVVTELIQLRGSRLARIVAEVGPEKAMEAILKNEDHLMEVVKAISQRAARRSTLSKMATDHAVLRRHLESLDAMIHQQGGGKWIQRTQETVPVRRGRNQLTEVAVWEDMDGNRVVSLVDQYSKAQLQQMAQAQGIPVTTSMTKHDLADAIYEATGMPNIDKIDEAVQFVIVEDGSEQVRKLIQTGEWGDEALLWDEMTVKEIQALEERITDLYSEANVIGPQTVRTMTQESRDTAKLSRAVDKVFEMLMQRPSTALARNPHFLTRYTEEVARMYLTADVDQRILIEGWVRHNGFELPWRRAVDKMLAHHGLKNVPGGPMSASQIDEGVTRYRLLTHDIGPEDIPPAPTATNAPIFDDVPDYVYDDMPLEDFMRTVAERDMPPEQYRRELARRIVAGETTDAEVLRVAEATEFGEGDTVLDVMRNDGVLRYEESVPNPELDGMLDDYLALGTDDDLVNLLDDLRSRLADQLKAGEITQQEIEEAIGRLAARHNVEDERILDRLTTINTHLSGVTGEARGFNAVTGARGGDAVVPSMFSNKALGILTDDQDLLAAIDDIAKYRAIEDTKALFYDLTRRANFTDMARYIFPFGDAFLEQLRIWSRAMTPVGDQTGRALTNWRRLQVGVTNARKSGFFSEDKYGNEVMNWPGAGLLTGAMGMAGGDLMGATLRPDQLMMMNLTPRGGLIPGTSAFVQIPTAALQSTLDQYPPLRDIANWFAFGDYGPTDLDSVGDAFSAVSPTWMRRFASAVFGDENREEYANDKIAAAEALIMSGDPKYGDDPERAPKTLEDANKLGQALAYLRILDGFFSPGQPTYTSNVLITVAGKDPYWMSTVALADEYRAAREYFGDDNAILFMKKNYGIDPLTLVGATREVVARPVTKEAYDFAQEHNELYDLGPEGAASTMMLWLPSDKLDGFYPPAYERTKDEGDREQITDVQAMAIRQQRKGYVQLEAAQRIYDTQAASIDYTYQGNHRHEGWRQSMADLDRWYMRRKRDIWAQYPPSDPEREIKGLDTRPTYYDAVAEVVAAGTPGTKEYEITSPIDPEMSDWVTKFATMWKNLEEISIEADDKAHGRYWWLTASDERAQSIRRTTQQYLTKITQETLAAAPPDRIVSLEGQIGWFMERIIDPLFDGYSIEDEIWLGSTPTPPMIDRSQEQPTTVFAEANR
jgi:hypothetical protein